MSVSAHVVSTVSAVAVDPVNALVSTQADGAIVSTPAGRARRRCSRHRR
ncbi:hypothetical protein [Cryptosporangium arvum]|nr:hypothetical protein [Cryptosporangium arvum]